MKFKIGDQVLVTSGKDKGKKSKIVKVLPTVNKVVVEGINMFVKHVKPVGDRPGEKKSIERPLNVANIAIINDKGKADRVGYKVSKSGEKQRIYKKTGSVIEQNQKVKEIKETKVDKKADKKAKKDKE
jgi:large subunit ribosomal protein L24